MKTIFFDCNMGAAGDMISAALYELLNEAEQKSFIEEMNALGLHKVSVSPKKVSKSGIVGTAMQVLIDGKDEADAHHHEIEHISDEHHHTHHHHTHHDHSNHSHSHHHSSLNDIQSIINNLAISTEVKRHAMEVYTIIAEAESKVHGVSTAEIHFHEVGTLDAVADIVSVCRLMEILHPDQVIASPVHVGSGQVRCAHGILPVPAPATAYILRNIPIYGGNIQGELCTPTGAALLKYYVASFGCMPIMSVQKIGYGMGKKDFETANCLRVMMGDTTERNNVVFELQCNIDDMSPERIGFAQKCLFQAGALDVYTVPVGMKKSRPGVLLCVICEESNKSEVIQTIFRHTTTLGLREICCSRYTLHRNIESVSSRFGSVRKKCAEGYGVRKEKYEYEDLAKIAEAESLSIEEVIRILENK